MACEHKRTDWAWSHGHLERCLDCGAVNETFPVAGWTDPMQIFRDAVNSGNSAAAYHMSEYLKQAKAAGIPYPVRLAEENR